MRQRIRSGIILVVFLSFPITLNYLSPVVGLAGLAQRVIAGDLLLFGLQFLSALVLGRAWCGWACPAAGLTEACQRANDRRVRGGRLNWIKYLIWVPWVGLLLFIGISAGMPLRIDPLFNTASGISVSEPWMYIIYYGVVGVIVVLSFAVGRRAFCHYVCWMAPFMVIGTKLRDGLRLPGLRLRPKPEQCTDCKTCTKNCPMSLDVNAMVKRGSMKDSECILCGRCVDGCAKHAITYRFGR
jgi:ferredoxin-type protein NapH